MELILIRHGQSMHNAGLSHLWDSPLSEKGRQQAKHAAQALQSIEIQRLFCSPMRRAADTACILAEGRGIAPEALIELSEHGFGWEEAGMTEAEWVKQYPTIGAPHSTGTEGWAFNRLTETMHEMRLRMRLLADDFRSIAAAGEVEAAAVVIHGKSGTELLKSLLSVPAEAAVYFHHANCAITRLYFEASGNVNLMCLNDRAHLDGSEEMGRVAPGYR